MICRSCQSEVAESSNYCSRCGARQSPAAVRRRLMRSRTDSRIGGVCGGIGEYFDIDPTIVRVLWVVLSVVPGCLVGGLVAYVALWIIVPKAPAATPVGMSLEPHAKAS